MTFSGVIWRTRLAKLIAAKEIITNGLLLSWPAKLQLHRNIFNRDFYFPHFSNSTSIKSLYHYLNLTDFSVERLLLIVSEGRCHTRSSEQNKTDADCGVLGPKGLFLIAVHVDDLGFPP